MPKMEVRGWTPVFKESIRNVLHSDSGELLGVGKIGRTSEAIQRLKNEAEMLKYLTQNSLERIITPKLLYEGYLDDQTYFILQTPLNGEKVGVEFSESYFRLMESIFALKNYKEKFSNSRLYKILEEDIVNYPITYRRLLLKAWEYIKDRVDNKELFFGLNHGDFTPWNIYLNREKFAIFDWESASFDLPFGFDYVHFKFQVGTLLKKLRVEKLLQYLQNYAYRMGRKILSRELQWPLLLPISV